MFPGTSTMETIILSESFLVWGSLSTFTFRRLSKVHWPKESGDIKFPLPESFYGGVFSIISMKDLPHPNSQALVLRPNSLNNFFVQLLRVSRKVKNHHIQWENSFLLNDVSGLKTASLILKTALLIQSCEKFNGNILQIMGRLKCLPHQEWGSWVLFTPPLIALFNIFRLNTGKDGRS